MSWVGMVTGRPSAGFEDVVARQHEDAGLGLRLRGERHVDGHLVTVEVGVEGRADERVDLDGLALDELRLEGLDAEAVQRVGARLSSTGCSVMTSSRTSHTTERCARPCAWPT